MKIKARFLTWVAILLATGTPVSAAPILQDNDFVAICGDSITAQRQYSLYIQQYLMLCQPKQGLMTMQFGSGGEKAFGLISRLDHEVLRFKPTVATLCYGMNDGQYNPVNEKTAIAYRKSLVQLVQKLKEAKVRTIVVGSPGVVDPRTYKRPNSTGDQYNETLALLAKQAQEVAAEEGVAFADVHHIMKEGMLKAKAALGEEHTIAGDGVHPSPNGQFAMAYAFLKAFGVDGEIGRLTLDLKNGTAEGSSGHAVKSFKDGELVVESARYPFCFPGSNHDSSPKSMSRFIPFDEELNRYILVVKGAPERARVTWGTASKEFTGEQLAAGVNLAVEFPENPFSLPFTKASNVLIAQQEYESLAILSMLGPVGRLKASVPEGKTQIDELSKMIEVRTGAFREASRAAVQPVTHTLKISAL